jgi:hypothetical protein
VQIYRERRRQLCTNHSIDFSKGTPLLHHLPRKKSQGTFVPTTQPHPPPNKPQTPHT